MPFIWDAKSRKYSSNGRAITDRQVREWIADAVDRAKSRIESFSLEAKAGRINRAEWGVRMKEEILNMHRAASMIASGGRSQVNNRTWSRVGSVVRFHNQKFQTFFAEVTTDLTKLNTGRATMYADGMFATFENMVRAREMKAGMKFEQRIRSAISEHCADCDAEAAKGRQPIGTLRAIADSSCMTRCNCHYEYFEDAA